MKKLIFSVLYLCVFSIIAQNQNGSYVLMKDGTKTQMDDMIPISCDKNTTYICISKKENKKKPGNYLISRKSIKTKRIERIYQKDIMYIVCYNKKRLTFMRLLAENSKYKLGYIRVRSSHNSLSPVSNKIRTHITEGKILIVVDNDHKVIDNKLAFKANKPTSEAIELISKYFDGCLESKDVFQKVNKSYEKFLNGKKDTSKRRKKWKEYNNNYLINRDLNQLNCDDN